VRIIAPQRIGEAIVDLIDDAHEFLVIVSPYNKISGWTLLRDALAEARDRGVDVHYYTRDEQTQIEAVQRIGIEPVAIPRLHAKLYLNESNAIFGSMNLHQSSDAESVELVLATERSDEYRAIRDYYDRYIAPFGPNGAPPEILEEAVCRHLAEIFPDRSVAWRWAREGARVDVGRRNFFISVETRAGESWVEIMGILPGVLADYLGPRERRIQRRSRTKVEFRQGDRRHYASFFNTFKGSAGDPENWSRQEIDDTAEFIAMTVAAAFNEIAESSDSEIAREF
jgi:hypothetical protein